MQTYIEATLEAQKKFYADYHVKGKIVMLNLVRFHETARYTDKETMDSAKVVSGKISYQKYIDKVVPLLYTIGSRVLFSG